MEQLPPQPAPRFPSPLASSTASINEDNPLHGQTLHIPNLHPLFASWNQSVNPLHAQVKQAVDARLEGLIDDERALAKVKGADLGLFASGLFPDASYEVLETAAFYLVWLFLWDDAIDCAEGDVGEGLTAEEYCRRSVVFVRYSLGLGGSESVAPKAPTRVCESFGEVGRRMGEYCGPEQRTELFGRLEEYLEGCVAEYKWRLSGKAPTVEEFFSWRLRTSSVDVFLVLCRILNSISLPDDILKSTELATMGLCINKLLIIINELFSLKKELKDGAFGNLIPITMRASNSDLSDATESVVQDIHHCVRDFNHNALAIRETAAKEHGSEVVGQLDNLSGAYQAIATSVLNFSSQSPRYGLLKDRQEDGSFVVVL